MEYFDGGAGGRWVERTGSREVTKDALTQGRLSPINSQELLARRVARLQQVHHIREATLERIIGGDELLSSTYLTRGAQAMKAVGRVVIGNSEGYGTGFLVAPRVLMTNNHVLKTAADARKSSVQFNYEERPDGSVRPRTFKLAPDQLFITSAPLDYSVVAIDGPKDPGTSQGVLPLIGAAGKALLGEWLNIVQHPEGQTKRIAIRQNRLSDELPKFLHYEADTNPGSSGSPVLNDQWEVVALHHSGVPKTDDKGQYLKADGSVWADDEGLDAIAWVANEGVRASVIVKDLKKRRVKLDATGQALLDTVFKAGESA
ncbi:MAG: serine protease [Candidatus Nanopelagicales bacterium]